MGGDLSWIWISGNRQISFRAIRKIWAEPNCVRVVHMILAYTISISGWILPSLPCQCAFCMKIRHGIFLLFTEKRAPDGYTDGLFWSFDIESHLMISPERVKSHSMTFHRAIKQIFKNLSAHFTSFPRLPGSKKWRLSEWSFTNAHFLLGDDGCSRFLRETDEVMRRGWTVFSSDFSAELCVKGPFHYIDDDNSNLV